MKKNLIKIFLICLTLAACGGGDLKDKLGISHKGPDEFRVVSRPPLSVPPEFNLRPPRSSTNERIASDVGATEQARNQVINANNPFASQALSYTAVSPVSSGSLPSRSDSHFLSNAGADKSSSTIRETLRDESENGVEAKDSTYLIPLGKREDPLVDAKKEAERLKKAKDEHTSPSEGTTPVIEQKGGGLLGNIF